MADEAPNTGNNQSNLDGFGDTSSGPWALEETLKKVLGTLQKDLQNGTRQNRSFDVLNRNIDRLANSMNDASSGNQENRRQENSNASQTRRALDDIKRSSDRAAKAQEEANRSNKPDKNTARDNLLGGGGGGGGALGMVKDIAMAGAKKVLSAGEAIMNSQGDLANATAGVAKAIPIFGGLLASASVMVTNARAQLAELAKTGQTVNYSMIDFANAATKAGLSTAQAASIISANSETAAKMGTTGFLDLQRAVRATTEKFGRFGYSLDDQAKITASFYENQMTLGKRSTATNAKAIADYTAKLSTLSKLTGKSIDTLLDEEKKIAESPDVFAAANRIFQRDGQRAADNFYKVVNDSTHQLPDSMKAMSEQMLSDYGKYGSIATSELGAVLANSGAGDIVNQLDKAISSGDSKAYADALKKLSIEGSKVGSDLAIHLSDLAASTGPAAESAKRVIAGMREYQKTNGGITDIKGQTQQTMDAAEVSDTATKDQNDTQTQTALSAAYAATLAQAEQLEPALQQLTIAAAQMTAAFMNSEIVSEVTHQFSDAIVDATQHMQEWVSSMSAFETLDSVLGSAINSLFDFGGWLGRTIGIGEGLGKILTGLGAWFGGKALLGQAGKGVASLFGFGGAAGGAAEGAAGAGVRGLAGGALKGLARGGLIGAALEGIGYLGPNGKTLSWGNLGRSAFKLGGGLVGGALGSFGGPLGTVAGGAAGYAGASWLSDKLFGPDEMRNAQPKPGAKPAAQPPRPPRPIPRVQVRPPTAPPPSTATEDAAKALAARRAALKEQQDAVIARARANTAAAAERARNPIRTQPAIAAPVPTKPVTPPVANNPVTHNNRPGAPRPTAAPKPNADSSKVAFPVGDEMQNRQLQEMQTTNKILMGIYGNGKPKLKPSPSVVMYNGFWA